MIISHVGIQVRLLLEWGAEVMVIDNKGKLPLHLVGQSASQKNRGKSEDIIKLLKSKMPEDDLDGEECMGPRHCGMVIIHWYSVLAIAF